MQKAEPKIDESPNRRGNRQRDSLSPTRERVAVRGKTALQLLIFDVPYLTFVFISKPKEVSLPP
jgi:hypothetical protein